MRTAELAERVRSAPKGRHIAAFFDYDGTVIRGYSALAFYRKRLRGGDLGPIELAKTLRATADGVRTDGEFDRLLRLSLGAWRGRTEEEVSELGEELFRRDIASYLHTEVWQLVQEHRRQGHTVVLASSATRFQTEPMARELGVDHVLCTRVRVVDGVLTGEPDGPPLWGPGKARAVRDLADEHGIDLTESFAYSNGDEDVPFLETVGHPVAVEPGDALAEEADARGWPVLRCVPRGGSPDVADLLRTAGFYGAFAAAFGAGIGLGLVNKSRRQVFEITGGVGADLGLALAGVDVDVVAGAEHLWSARPCVFVFNHQSLLDPVLVMKILRRDFTGVAKKEAKKIPLFGQLFRIADVAFVDRGNTAQAKQALAPAVAKVRDQGISLALSPEGTRSVTPRLGRFKKGAFHIAMQAGVPMVPIVIRNAGEVMWRGNRTLRPGRVEIAVRPPVDTSDWRVDTIDEHVEQVREVFVRTLADWPGDDG